MVVVATVNIVQQGLSEEKRGWGAGLVSDSGVLKKVWGLPQLGEGIQTPSSCHWGHDCSHSLSHLLPLEDLSATYARD